MSVDTDWSDMYVCIIYIDWWEWDRYLCRYGSSLADLLEMDLGGGGAECGGLIA